MAYVVLVGIGGWVQRWEIAPGAEDAAREAIKSVGGDGQGTLQVVDDHSEDKVELVVAWAAVATAVVLPAAGKSTEAIAGLYA